MSSRESIAAQILLEAVEHDPGNRPAFIQEACAGDPILLNRVEALVRAHDQANPLLDGERLVATLEQPPPEQLCAWIGPYKLRELLGEGGMGSVYVAEQEQPVRRKVALKIIKPGMDSRQVLARFEAERQALALMDHPNIAKVLDAGTTDSERPYFVMELVRGVPITEFCDQRRLTPRQRLELFIQVCRAIQHAHQKGIIHRDIKPSNILVTLHDDLAVPKVIDFGIAKATNQQLTEQTVYTAFNQMIGTPPYMSPEQAEMNALDVDTRSDVYSLGVLLYELLTGSTPFDSDTMRQAGFDEMRRLIREVDPPRPSQRVSTLGAQAASTVSKSRGIDERRLHRMLHGELDLIVMKALEKDRTRRYESSSVLAADVERYLNDEPVQACPPSAVYRFGKFARRNRTALAIATAVFSCLLILTAGLGWVFRDRAARQGVADATASIALDEATRLIEQEKWPESLLAVKRAEDILAIGEGGELATRAQELCKDVEMVLQLEEIRFSLAYSIGERWPKYEQAFQDYGINLQKLQPSEAAARIRDRKVNLELVLALDNWAGTLSWRNGPGWTRLVEVARLADPDPLRNRLRDTFSMTGTERKTALKNLAISPESQRLEPHSAVLLAQQCEGADIFEAAIGPLRAAQRRHPENHYVNFWLGFCHARMNPSQTDEAIRFLTGAIVARPGDAMSHAHLGAALAEKGLLDDAIASYKEAIRLKPDDEATHNNLGSLLNQRGEREEARAEYLAAIELGKELVEQNPDVREYKIDLGRSSYNYGRTILNERKPAESLEWFDLAICTLQPVYQQEPGDVATKRSLLFSHGGRAEAYGHLDKPAESIKDWDRCIALAAPAEQHHFRVYRTTSQVKVGMAAEAVAEVATLAKTPNLSSDYWYNFACVYALAGGQIADKKQEYADRAMEMLRKSVQTGYNDVVNIAKDTDLDPLRDREDFQKLLATLAAPDPKSEAPMATPPKTPPPTESQPSQP